MRGNFHKYTEPDVYKKEYRVDKFYGVDGISPDETLSLGYAKYMCNLSVSNGRISGCFGVDNAMTDGKIIPCGALIGKLVKSAGIYRKNNYVNGENCDIVVYQMSDNKIYTAEIGKDETLTDTSIEVAEGKTNFLNYYYNDKDNLLIFDSNGTLNIYDGSSNTQQTELPVFADVCVHKGRIYGIVNKNENELKFSAPYNPLEWKEGTDGAGRIKFTDEGGALRKIIECGNELFIIRDYAIYKLTAYEDMSEYTLIKVFVGDSRIYSETAVSINNKLIFMTEDGFFSYNGKTFEKVWRDIFPYIDNAEYAAAIGCGDRYYLTAHFVTEGDELIGDEEYCNYNNGIMAVSVLTGGVSFLRGADASKFLKCNYGGKTYVLIEHSPGIRAMQLGMITDDGKIYDKSVKKIWRSPKTPLSYITSDKVLRKFYIKTNVPLNVTLSLDKDYEFALPASTKIQSVTVNKRAETIAVKIETSGENPLICGFYLDLELVDRREYGGY